jgi:hypothetical protein
MTAPIRHLLGQVKLPKGVHVTVDVDAVSLL